MSVVAVTRRQDINKNKTKEKKQTQTKPETNFLMARYGTSLWKVS